MREKFPGTREGDSPSVGGAVFYKKNSFLSGGLENENFISYAPEDQERYYRFGKLGYKIQRIKGCLYHIDHYVGVNSYTQHPLYKANEKEYHRIRAIQDLKAEIETWPWYHKYSLKYYSEIIDDSTKSRDEFFKLPEIAKAQSIIDVGCGLGFWGKDLSIIYNGVDHDIPERMLIIPKENYKEYDLTSSKPFPFQRMYDLCLCLEVLEHIPEEYAEKSVALLTSLSDNVLFSAAIPGQGGHQHINEKFQSYWAGLFSTHGYYPNILPIRENYNISIWYRNNAILYTKSPTNQIVEDYVHPELYSNVVGTLTKWKDIKPYR
jgi:hypothetical protein